MEVKDKMENLEITSISSRGQVVIPQNLREKFCIQEGEKFAVLGEDGIIILKRIVMPSKKQLLCELDRIAEKGRKQAEKLGIKEKDVPDIVHRFRKEKKSKT